MEEIYGPHIFQEPLTSLERSLLENDPVTAVLMANIDYQLRESARVNIENEERAERFAKQNYLFSDPFDQCIAI